LRPNDLDAHRDDGKRFVVHGDEILTAFLDRSSNALAANRIDEQRGFPKKLGMKLRLLLGLVLSGLLCDCGNSSQGDHTITAGSSHRTGPQPIAAHAAAHHR
jgi:hypothetical protein